MKIGIEEFVNKDLGECKFEKKFNVKTVYEQGVDPINYGLFIDEEAATAFIAKQRNRKFLTTVPQIIFTDGKRQFIINAQEIKSF